MSKTEWPGAAIFTNEIPEPGYNAVEPRKPNTIDERVVRTEVRSYGGAWPPLQVNLLQGPNDYKVIMSKALDPVHRARASSLTQKANKLKNLVGKFTPVERNPELQTIWISETGGSRLEELQYSSSETTGLLATDWGFRGHFRKWTCVNATNSRPQTVWVIKTCNVQRISQLLNPFMTTRLESTTNTLRAEILYEVLCNYPATLWAGSQPNPDNFKILRTYEGMQGISNPQVQAQVLSSSPPSQSNDSMGHLRNVIVQVEDDGSDRTDTRSSQYAHIEVPKLEPGPIVKELWGGTQQFSSPYLVMRSESCTKLTRSPYTQTDRNDIVQLELRKGLPPWNMPWISDPPAVQNTGSRFPRVTWSMRLDVLSPLRLNKAQEPQTVKPKRIEELLRPECPMVTRSTAAARKDKYMSQDGSPNSNFVANREEERNYGLLLRATTVPPSSHRLQVPTCTDGQDTTGGGLMKTHLSSAIAQNWYKDGLRDVLSTGPITQPSLRLIESTALPYGVTSLSGCEQGFSGCQYTSTGLMRRWTTVRGFDQRTRAPDDQAVELESPVNPIRIECPIKAKRKNDVRNVESVDQDPKTLQQPQGHTGSPILSVMGYVATTM
ncbi:hypothetical protein BS47DRAFT_1365969 [Hydnum rufescens UP504]|uniref:Uncharacterized protein n=1 Tax=Hydnum rufescens UP504 TaxID=1448309 RepID=A0A9P6DRH8_9AGAM|nr:hypothetical protein BS47DRAFT_1365969 [Hydnum rufescens UP504]